MTGCDENTIFNVTWAMPSRWTFQIKPIGQFVDKWLDGCGLVVDPFAGKTQRGHLNNDMGMGGVDANEWLTSLLPEYESKVDAVLFDPPYSPRQIKECYDSIGLKATTADTQSGRRNKEVRDILTRLLKPGGIALSFGWSSSGFGIKFKTLEILLCRHGGAHNDTICVAQQKPPVSTP